MSRFIIPEVVAEVHAERAEFSLSRIARSAERHGVDDPMVTDPEFLGRIATASKADWDRRIDLVAERERLFASDLFLQRRTVVLVDAGGTKPSF